MSRRTLTKAAALLIPLAGALAYQGFAPEETLAADSTNILTIQGRLTTG